MAEPINIVAGVDFSDASINAVREAQRRAELANGCVHLVHIIDDEAINELPPATNPDEPYHRALTDTVLRELDAIMQRETTTATRQRHCIVGDPAQSLLDYAQSVHAAMLVLARNSRSDPSRGAGSYALRCVRDASMDVMLIHSKQHTPNRTIAACIDFSELSFNAAERAAVLAAEDHASLLLIHAYRPPWDVVPFSAIPVTTPTDFQTQYADNVNASMKRLVDSLQNKHPALSIDTHIELAGSIGSALLTALDEHDVDLAVVGSHGRGALGRLLLGSTAERIIRDAHCSVLTIKQHEAAQPSTDG
jgi:nucleotide-binding universal stress UspA family protein